MISMWPLVPLTLAFTVLRLTSRPLLRMVAQRVFKAPRDNGNHFAECIWKAYVGVWGMLLMGMGQCAPEGASTYPLRLLFWNLLLCLPSLCQRLWSSTPCCAASLTE